MSLFLLFVGLIGYQIDVEYALGIRVVLVVAILALSVTYVWRAYDDRTRRPDQRHVHPPLHTINPVEVDRLFSDTGKGTLEISQAAFFFSVLAKPQDHFARISEQVSRYHRSIKIRTTYTVNVSFNGAAFDDAKGPDFVVPIHQFVKGEMLDGLRVTNGDAKRVSTLSSDHQAAFAAAVIRYMVRSAGASALAHYKSTLEAEVWKLIVAGHAPNDQAIAKITDGIAALPRDAAASTGLRMANVIVRNVASFQHVCVLIPSTSVASSQWPFNFRFGMERRVMAVPRHSPIPTPPGRIQQIQETLREWLGVRTHRFYIRLESAQRTHSYHLEVEGPEGTYLSRNEVLRPSERAPEIHATLQPRLGQRRSHLYVTRISKGGGPIYFAAAFYERAPGSFAPLIFSSLAASVVLGLLSAQQLEELAGGNPPPHPWLLPSLLAVPLAVTTLAGIDSGKSLRHPSLLSLGINVATVLLCLFAFTVASWVGNDVKWTSAVWMTLPYIGVSLVVVSVTSWILRGLAENHFVRGKDIERKAGF